MQKAGTLIVGLGAALLMVGCTKVKQPAEGLRVNLEQENARLQQKISEQDLQIAELKRQLAQLRGMPTENLELLVQVERIEFGRFTRAYDEDKDGIDDGMVVYLVTRDREGQKIKTVGDVRIELWDLEAAEGERELGQWEFGRGEILNYWLDGWLTDHFKFELAWAPDKRPGHSNLTVKLVYADALMGKVFEKQTMVEARVR